MNDPRNDNGLNDADFTSADALNFREDSIETAPAEVAEVAERGPEEKPATTDSVLKSVRPVYGGGGGALSSSSISSSSSSAPSSRRFLAAYITSILSALSLLSSGACLGYALLDHFLTPKESSLWSQYFDLSPLYLGLITSMIVFGTLYLITSQYVARQVARDTVGVRDWRAYRIVYSGFTAILLTVAASILGSLLYIPLSLALVVQDYEAHAIWIQVLGGLYVLMWIGVLIWQERLVKHGKKAALQGVVVSVLVVLVVILSAMFLVVSKTDERYDKRAVNDLSAIESAINSYKSSNRGELPNNLDALDFSSKPLVEKRLGSYKYTVTEQEPEEVATDDYYGRDMMFDTDLFAQTDDLNAGDSDSLWGSVRSRDTEKTRGYTLCATFRTESTEKDDSPIGALLMGASGSGDSFWVHKKGETCFDRN